MTKTSNNPIEKLLLIFLICWTIINFIQGYFTEVHPDEAYYYLYSRFLDWGYFDHPPMVALFIKAGDFVFSSKLGIRLLSILTSTGSIYLLWKIVEKYSSDIKIFLLIFLSILLFHVYGFISTPDSPLLFFSILFWFVYQRYIDEDKVELAIFLSLIIACLLYSKYHGILLLFFTLLSNLKLLRRPSFYLIVSLSIILFLPHIFWQYKNGFPSVYYHIIDRSASPYEYSYTLDYLIAQVLIAGPLTGWFFYYSAIRVKRSDLFIKALYFNFWGIFIFFLISTFKGRVEAHWTLIGFVPLFILSYLSLTQNVIPKWFSKVAIANICLIILARICVIIPFPVLKDFEPIRYYFGSEKWAKKIHSKVGDEYVIFEDGFQDASKYDFYNRTTRGFAYDSRDYRKTQFDIWPLEDSLRNKRVYYVTYRSLPKYIIKDTISTTKGNFVGAWIDSARLFQKVKIESSGLHEWKTGAKYRIKIKVYNPYDKEVSFSNKGEKWKCYLEYGFSKNGKLGKFKSSNSGFEKLRILPNKFAEITALVHAPLQTGNYKLIFSIRTEPFAGARNSNMISVYVK